MTRHKKKKRRVLWAFRSFRAGVIRRRVCRDTKVIAVTGSCAKTSTTFFLGKIMSDAQPGLVGVDANGQAGIIRNILKLKRGHRFFVQEVGVDCTERMKGHASLLRPDIAVVTTIGQDHYTSFRTLEATAAEKGLLVEALLETGVAVLNADDPYVAAMALRSKAHVITYGLNDDAEVRASDIKSTWPERLSMTVTHKDENVRIETGLFGDLLVTSVLAAIAGALAAGLDLRQCARSLHLIEAFPRRLSIHHTGNGIWFVNDTFKAPFWSVEKVVALFEHATAPRKTLVFGSFSDTPGSDSQKYRSTARLALEVADRVIFVGKKAGYVRKMFSPETEGRLLVFGTPEEALRLLTKTALKDELVLIKSNVLEHLERLIDGQAKTIRCWKGSCTKQVQCNQCEESGLL